MSNNINLIAFGTFGNPNGFTQTFFTGNPIDVKTFDIRGSIFIYPKSELYSIRKEYKAGHNLIAYTLYSYAKEPTSAREGSFIGSSILFTEKIAEENITIKCLNEFHKNLKNRNVQNDVITVTHSKKFDVSNCKPKDFGKISFNLRKIENLNFSLTNKNLVVFCDLSKNQLQTYFKKSIDLLNIYDCIYFTQDKEIAQFVKQKGIFPLIQNVGDKTEFEYELQKLVEERETSIRITLEEFSREKQRLENDRKRFIEEHDNQIQQNEKQHQANEDKILESKNEIQAIDNIYEAFSKNIEELINLLKSDENVDAVKQLYNTNKENFIYSRQKILKPNSITSISKPNIRPDLRGSQQPRHKEKYELDRKYDGARSSKEIDFFKVATFALFLLWIGTLAYFLFFNKPKKEMQTIYDPQEQLEKTERNPISEVEKELFPTSNFHLNEKEYKIVAKKIKEDMSIDEVVEIIFTSNPTDIKSSYSNQQDEYSKELFRLNKNSFVEKENKISFTGDTLKNIPAYKKQ